MTNAKTYRALFPFSGLGAGALGFLRASATLFGVEQRFVSIGGIDLDADACKDFERLTGSPALCADVAKLTVEQLRAFAGDGAPDVVFSSPPCQGFSGLLGEAKSQGAKYQALNELLLTWTRLMLEAWPGQPPKLVLIENVPRIETRGKKLLADVKRLLRARGYVFHGSSHDCGEIGGLAQHRQRYLLVARHASSTPALLYQPLRKRVRGCGEVLGLLPLPGDPSAGPLHRLPRISTLNWLRLSLIRPGGDWRDIERGVERTRFSNVLRLHGWDEPAGAVNGGAGPSSGAAAVADVRVSSAYPSTYGVLGWAQPSHAVTGNSSTPGGGPFSVADPRVPIDGHHGTYGVCLWASPLGVVAGASRVSNGRFAVADPRPPTRYHGGAYGVRSWRESCGAVCGESAISNGAFGVADPRVRCAPRNGAYGVASWWVTAGTVTGSLQIDNGPAAVADPRVPGTPSLRVAYYPADLRSPPPWPLVLPTEDGTWHRPLTTLELAALQGLPTMLDGAPLTLAGTSSTEHRRRIGNAVPVAAAEAIARQMLLTLATSRVGFALSGEGGVWVRPSREVLS